MESNSQAIAEKIRGKIHEGVLELMPEENWSVLIKKEIDAFVEPSKERGQFVASPLTKLVHAEVEKHFNERLQEYMKEYVFTEIDYEMHFGKLIEQATTIFARSVGTSLVGNVMQALAGVAGMGDMLQQFGDLGWCHQCEKVVTKNQACSCGAWIG